MTTETIDYVVVREFKYNGKEYKTGDLWKPEGSRWDSKIANLDNKFVMVPEATKKRNRGVTRRRKAKEVTTE